MVLTPPMAPFMASAASAGEAAGSRASMAEMPWGTVVLGTTITSRSVRPTHCWAAMMIFLLLGSTITDLPPVASTARRMSSVEGFMVWPPETISSAPSSRNRLASPSPAQTETMPRGLSGAAGLGAGALGAALVPEGWASSSLAECCRRMFSTFTVWSAP